VPAVRRHIRRGRRWRQVGRLRHVALGWGIGKIGRQPAAEQIGRGCADHIGWAARSTRAEVVTTAFLAGRDAAAAGKNASKRNR
jgi:hypothetical protein